MGYLGVIYPVEEPGERRLGVRTLIWMVIMCRQGDIHLVKAVKDYIASIK